MGKTQRMLALGALLCTACANDGLVTARGDMQPLVDAACDWMFNCCASDELTYQVGSFTVDSVDCSERMLDAIEAGAPLDLVQDGLSDDPAQGLLVLAQSINAGRVYADADAVRACAAATSSRACNAPLVVAPSGRCTPTPAEPAVNPCDPSLMFIGRQRAGQACDGAFECEGELNCIDFGVGGVCSLPSGQGETCFSDAECGDDLLCDWVRGICVRGAQAGEPCAFNDPEDPIPGTETIRCATGLICDPEGRICANPYCVAGAPCGDIFNDTDCPDGYFCVGTGAGTATCRLPGDAGQVCSKDADCASGYCDPTDDVCAARLPVGSTCSSDPECASGFCDLNVCGATVGAGQPCPSFDSAQCQDGFCDTTTVTPTCRAYAAENGACPFGNECNPDDDLLCVDGLCRRPPFDNGVSCFAGGSCRSQICYAGVCNAGAPAGSTCRFDGTTPPCTLGTYCDVPEDAVAGTCAALRRPGQACTESAQCWGSCITRFGTRMCDTTTALALDEVWCDGR